MNCRGDRASGKTTLFKRLQGDKFSDEYEQSEEISVSAIQWNHKATDDIVKGLVTINMKYHYSYDSYDITVLNY